MSVRHPQASAKKSNGRYKPMVKIPMGASKWKTQILEQSPEMARYWKDGGWIPGQRFAQGSTYVDRAAAVDVARAWLRNKAEALAAQVAEAEQALETSRRLLVAFPENISTHRRVSPENVIERRSRALLRLRREHAFWGGAK